MVVETPIHNHNIETVIITERQSDPEINSNLMST